MFSIDVFITDVFITDVFITDIKLGLTIHRLLLASLLSVCPSVVSVKLLNSDATLKKIEIKGATIFY